MSMTLGPLALERIPQPGEPGWYPGIELDHPEAEPPIVPAGVSGRRPRLLGGRSFEADESSLSTPRVLEGAASVLPNSDQYLANQTGFSLPPGVTLADVQMFDSGPHYRDASGNYVPLPRAMNTERLLNMATPGIGGSAERGALRSGIGPTILRGVNDPSVLSSEIQNLRRQQVAFSGEHRTPRTRNADERILRPNGQEDVFREPTLADRLNVPQVQHQAIDRLRIENNIPAGAARAPTLQRGADQLIEMGPDISAAIARELDPAIRLMRGLDAPDANARHRIAANAGLFYRLGPVYERLIADGKTPQEATQWLRERGLAIAGTSPRTDTTQNTINSTLFNHRYSEGMPITPAAMRGIANPGYRMMYGTHAGLTDRLLTGRASMFDNPKPITFGENIAGDLSGVTADVHDVRAILLRGNDIHPGALPRVAFTTDAGFEQYLARGGRMSDAELRKILTDMPRGQQIAGRSIPTEYPIFHDITADAGRRMGVDPADAQAMMWFYYGDRTGLRSPPSHIPRLLNDRLNVTAQATGIPPDRLWALYREGRIPLMAQAPVPAGGVVRGPLADDGED
jgi:hypothetical protein